MEENKGIDKPITDEEATKPNPFEKKDAKPFPVKDKELYEKIKTSELKFPREFSSIVYIRRKKNSAQLPREGEWTDESIAKIGPGYSGQSVLRGLTSDEEKRWLPPIIGIDPNSQNWEKATFDYWNSISKDIPPSNPDGSGGLKLEVGLKYDNEDQYLADINAPKSWADTCNKMPLGTPININDYILWRFSLVYSRVANTPDDVGKSPKIEFYLFSQEKKVKDDILSLKQRRSATQLMYSHIGDREWVEFMLRMFIKNDKAPTYGIKDLSSISIDEKDILLDKYMQSNPVLFVLYGEDKALEMKAFIEFAVALGVLGRIPNTSTVTLDHETLGNDLDQVVSFLNNPKNIDTLGRIKAQCRVKA